jgi:hypothetical protein
MFMNRFFRKILHPCVEGIDQVKLIYILSLAVGLLSALAAAILKNAIHCTRQILTNGITPESGSYLYPVYQVIGMLITLLFARYLVSDSTGAWNLPVPDKGYYVGFISKSGIYSRYLELLMQFQEE